MKKAKFPFLKCCEWLYQGALSTGALFVLYGFLQDVIIQADLFPSAGRLLGLIAAGTFGVQFMLVWSAEKEYLPYAGLCLLAINMAAGLLSWRLGETPAVFWRYAGLEVICIASALAVSVISQSLALQGCLIGAQTAGLVILAILQKPLPGLCISVMLSAFLFFLVELTFHDPQKRNEALGLLPLFTAAALLLWILPKSEEPLDWTWAKNAYASLQDTIKSQAVSLAYLLEDQNQFSFSDTGYGNAGKLGGFLLKGEQEQLHIYGNGTKNPLYLTGAVYDVYTGQDWQPAPPGTGHPLRTGGHPPENRGGSIPTQDRLLDALSHSVYAHQQEELLSSCLISVEYRFIKTADLFHELHTANLYGQLPPFQENTPWVMEQAQGKGFTYRVTFWEVNEESNEMKALLRQQAWQENTVWDEISLREESQIYQTCTQLPEDLPSRVYELAHTIAADADNDYDRMAAFARYLSDYTYTTNPPVCPEGQDFMDYFLFDSKSGYCTYFATAMAVLGRCEGIPTRYVKGFMTTDTCKNSSMDVTLTGQDAHAWTEAYIAHVGWVRFDGTPGYGEFHPDRWVPAEAANIDQKGNPYLQDAAPSASSEPVSAVQKSSDHWDISFLLKPLGTLLAGGILCLLLLWLLNTLRRRRYAAADPGEKLRIQLKRLLQLGKLQGAPLKEGETLQSYQRRIHGLLDTERYSFAQACALYEGMRFGEKNVSDLELKQLEAYGKDAENHYLTNCGFLKKLTYRVK